MGVCYTLILLDRFDWGYLETDKMQKLAQFRQEFGDCELVGQWYGAMVLDIDKKFPLLPGRKASIEKFCDAWYYIEDICPTMIRQGGGGLDEGIR